MTLNRMTLGRMTFSRMTFKKMALSAKQTLCQPNIMYTKHHVYQTQFQPSIALTKHRFNQTSCQPDIMSSKHSVDQTSCLRRNNVTNKLCVDQIVFDETTWHLRPISVDIFGLEASTKTGAFKSPTKIINLFVPHFHSSIISWRVRPRKTFTTQPNLSRQV